MRSSWANRVMMSMSSQYGAIRDGDSAVRKRWRIWSPRSRSRGITLYSGCIVPRISSSAPLGDLKESWSSDAVLILASVSVPARFSRRFIAFHRLPLSSGGGRLLDRMGLTLKYDDAPAGLPWHWGCWSDTPSSASRTSCVGYGKQLLPEPKRGSMWCGRRRWKCEAH